MEINDTLDRLSNKIAARRHSGQLGDIRRLFNAYIGEPEPNPDRTLNLALLVIIGIVMVVGIGFSVNFL